MPGRLLEQGDELALPWDDLSDGRAWVLVRGRDFFLNPREVEEAAENAAGRLGKAVTTIRSLRASVLSIWVQFADYRILAGMPCPCGSEDIRRINDEWAICADCESTLLVETPKVSGGDGTALMVATNGQSGDDPDAAARLRIFVREGGAIGDERKRLAGLRGADDEAKAKAAAERREAAVREREEKREVQAREAAEQKAAKAQAEAQLREEKKALARQTREARRQEHLAARARSREQQRQRLEAERGAQPGSKPRTQGPKSPPAPRPQQSSNTTLDRFANVRLWPSETQRPWRYWGYGYDPKGRFVLLEVTLQLTEDGGPVEDPGHAGRALHAVNAVRSAPFSAAVDADALLARTDGMSAKDVLALEPR
jgi:hypothetical protein